MTAVSLTPDDLIPFATIDLDKAWAMISDALAMAAVVAPCIIDADFPYPDAAKAILRGAVLRWDEAGTGAMQQVTSGPFSTTMDTRQARRGMFWPSEIQQLQGLCTTSGTHAVETDTMPAGGGVAFDPESWWSSPTTLVVP